jgi:hypothetical protein
MTAHKTAVVLTFRGHQIGELNALHDPDPARFGLRRS